MASGFRSLPPVPLGIAMPRPGACTRSMLAFWLGGACAPLLPIPPEPPQPIPPSPPSLVLPGGRQHHRPFNDDEEILEFLRLWVIWNDIE
jgi:hypothetical protein